METTEALQSVNALLKHSIIITGISAFLVTLLAFFLGRYMHRQIGSDPSELRMAAEAIGDGDLPERTHRAAGGQV